MKPPANWPTPSAINDRIALSARVNGTHSRLEGFGELIYKLGLRYGINPAIVVAIMQRECQCAADGSVLPTHNNFGGITDPNNVRGTCGRLFHIDRYWANYCSVGDGIEGIYKVLSQPNYRKPNATLGDIMELYSPPFENDWTAMFSIFSAVGKQLGVTLLPTTKVYYPGVRLKTLLRLNQGVLPA